MAANYTTNADIYMLNGVDLSTLGAFCESSKGFLELPQRKQVNPYSWADQHGMEYNLDKVYFEPRQTELILIVSANSYATLLTRINSITAEFKKAGLQYLKLANTTGIFLVAALEGVAVEKLTAHNSALVAARLTVPLVEPYYLTKQYSVNAAVNTVVSVTLTTSKPVFIDWGDKTRTYHRTGTATLSKTYTAAGLHCVVLYGAVDTISSITVTGLTLIS